MFLKKELNVRKLLSTKAYGFKVPSKKILCLVGYIAFYFLSRQLKVTLFSAASTI